MRTKTLAAWIAETAEWAERAGSANNAEWGPIARERLEQLVRMLPHGSGIDSGTELVSADSTKIVLTAGFHHMNDGGYYDGWTEHRITIRPTFGGLEVTISGRNRNDIKEYLRAVYSCALSDRIVETIDPETREVTYREERYVSAQ